MSPDSTPTEVFADVDPDPDAVLAEFGVDSPDDLGAASGAHDPTPDDAAVDDATAAELFADLQNIGSGDAEPAATGTDAPDRAAGTDEGADPVDDLAFEFVGDADIVVRDDGDVIDAAAADLDAVSGPDAPDRPPAERADDEATPSGTALESVDATGSAADADTDDPARRLTVRDDGAELELSGPEPTPTRIDDDAFGITADGGR